MPQPSARPPGKWIPLGRRALLLSSLVVLILSRNWWQPLLHGPVESLISAFRLPVAGFDSHGGAEDDEYAAGEHGIDDHSHDDHSHDDHSHDDHSHDDHGHDDHGHDDHGHDDHGHDDHGHDDHGHDHAGHDHAGHDDVASLHLSESKLRNLRLDGDGVRSVSLQTFRQTIQVPAIVTEKAGRTRVQVATPMTGLIDHVHVVEGEAVQPGTLLFRIHLTHEDLVKVQTTFVKTLGELDVEQKEITRLTPVTRSGAVPERILLNHQYRRDRLLTLLDAQKESLRLHGLSPDQVDLIAEKRRLLKELQMFAPTIDSHPEDEIKLSRQPIQPVALRSVVEHPEGPTEGEYAPLILQQLNAHRGQAVAAGQSLAVLSDLSSLWIEGRAYKQDRDALQTAMENEWPLTARFDSDDSDHTSSTPPLTVDWMANQIDPGSRTLRFYVDLKNMLLSDRRQGEHRFVEWQYFPGQRLQLQVPVAEWQDHLVLPVDAVAQDGVESYIFQMNADHFDRVPVQIAFRDQTNVVIVPKDTLTARPIAMRSAHQMQMALQKLNAGPVDMHAGHAH